jgi:hypothetical protein
MFNTIHDLVDDTKVKIQELNHIVDVLLAEYKAGSAIIDQEIDHRKKPLEQLNELSQALSDIVDSHPVSKSSGVNLSYQNTEWMKKIVNSKKVMTAV